MQTNKGLRAIFDLINEKFFEGKIPSSTIVRFAKILDDGRCLHSDPQQILINRGLRYFPDLSIIVLIHEMAHAYLHTQGYVGWDLADKGHQLRFFSEIDRLYRAGCYEGLL